MSEKIGVAFAATPTWILRADALSLGAKHLYSVMASYSKLRDGKRRATLARSTMAKECKSSLRTIARWITELEKFGAIEIARGGGRDSNTYTLFITRTGDKRGDATVSPVTPEHELLCHQSMTSGDTRASAPVTPEHDVQEKSKKTTEKSERETAREVGQPDELKTLRVTHESPPTKFKPTAKVEPEPNTFGDAFDATPTEPPTELPAENARVKSLTGYVFALFATKAPASQNRIAKMRAANPPRHEADIVQSVIAKDPSLTRNEISDLFEFATTHERYWRVAANDPVKFAKNLSRIATDFASDQPVRR